MNPLEDVQKYIARQFDPEMGLIAYEQGGSHANHVCLLGRAGGPKELLVHPIGQDGHLAGELYPGSAAFSVGGLQDGCRINKCRKIASCHVNY
jgi:hypothetical protein